MVTLSVFFSTAALVVSLVVAFLHYKRDRRESKKFEIEKKQLQSKLKFQVSEIKYFFDQGLDERGEYYEDHVVHFLVLIRNTGSPTIYLDHIGIVFVKPLLAKKIRSFSFGVEESERKLETGKTYKMRFSKSFKTKEEAYLLINSWISINCLDISDHLFSSRLIKPKIGGTSLE